MFAPNHRAVADELLRVCRPGGTIGMMNFTPEGTGGEFFALLAPYAPAPPPGADPPVSWGTEEHVRTLFGDRVSHLTMSRHTYVERAPSPADYCRLFTETFGPLVAIRHQSRGRAAAAGRLGSGTPGGDHSLEPRPIDRTCRDSLRVFARRRPAPSRRRQRGQLISARRRARDARVRRLSRIVGREHAIAISRARLHP